MAAAWQNASRLNRWWRARTYHWPLPVSGAIAADLDAPASAYNCFAESRFDPLVPSVAQASLDDCEPSSWTLSASRAQRACNSVSCVAWMCLSSSRGLIVCGVDPSAWCAPGVNNRIYSLFINV